MPIQQTHLLLDIFSLCFEPGKNFHGYWLLEGRVPGIEANTSARRGGVGFAVNRIRHEHGPTKFVQPSVTFERMHRAKQGRRSKFRTQVLFVRAGYLAQQLQPSMQRMKSSSQSTDNETLAKLYTYCCNQHKHFLVDNPGHRSPKSASLIPKFFIFWFFCGAGTYEGLCLGHTEFKYCEHH